MRPQSAVLPADIGILSTDEELCEFLQKFTIGSPLPSNVINDINPYQYLPSNLPPGNVWYLICCNDSKDTCLGYWRTKGEPSQIFPNSFITGWRATLEFYEGQSPHEHKTNWIMQEYWITRRKSSENSKSKEGRVLCRVQSLGAKPKSNCKVLEKMVTSDTAGHSTQHVVPRAENHTLQPSTSKPQVIKDNETGTLTITERLPEHHVEIMPEIAIDFISRDDYIELLDLDTPLSAASFSSSSSSSCVTISSDECFDSLALLEELEQGNRQDQMNKNTGCKCISVSQKPDELVMYAAASASGSLNRSLTEERVKSHSPITNLAVSVEIKENNNSKKHSRDKKPDHRDEGFSSSRTIATLPEGETKGTSRSKKIKKNYFWNLILICSLYTCS